MQTAFWRDILAAFASLTDIDVEQHGKSFVLRSRASGRALRAIFTAASKAQVAADWMHAQQPAAKEIAA